MFGSLKANGKIDFDYHLANLRRPFIMRLGNFEVELTEKQLEEIISIGSFMLQDYDRQRRLVYDKKK